MGSTPARTRLYQIAIARELAQALELFDIKGLTKTKKIAPPTHTLLPSPFLPALTPTTLRYPEPLVRGYLALQLIPQLWVLLPFLF